MISVILILFFTDRLYNTLGFRIVSSNYNDIKIVGLPGGGTQSLPGMYVRTFRRWIVEDGVNGDDREGTLKLEPIAGAGLTNVPYDEGWVDPTSTNELWWPSDIPTIQLRPVVNVLFRGGIVSYISSGLDVRVPRIDENTQGGIAYTSWRNYGMNSQPIARQWTSFEIAMEKSFHLEGFILCDQDDQDEQHESLFPRSDTQSVMRKIACFVSQLDSLSPISEGFHIVSFPVTNDWANLPPLQGNEGRDTTTYRVVCFATSEPFASKLLNLDEVILEMSSSSVLEVRVSSTDAGANSPYLTEPYRNLYLSLDQCG